MLCLAIEGTTFLYVFPKPMMALDLPQFSMQRLMDLMRFS